MPYGQGGMDGGEGRRTGFERAVQCHERALYRNQ